MTNLKEIITTMGCSEAARLAAVAVKNARRLAEYEDKYLIPAQAHYEPLGWNADDIAMAAEIAAREDFFLPPHFTGWVICRSCGPMPTHAGMKGQRVLCCPWCHILPDMAEHYPAVEAAAKVQLKPVMPKLENERP